MILQDLSGGCLFCGKQYAFDTHPNSEIAKRHCCTGSLALPRDLLDRDLHLFPTVFPVPRNSHGVVIPPHPASRPVVDGLAVAPHDPSLQPSGADATAYLPFLDTPLSLAGNRCGNALLYDAGRLATRFHLARGSVKVLDMATYGWSHTLKDPRSWAVISQAARSGVKHLSAWTAGNAGFSLARMAYAHNKFVQNDQKLHVHCYSIGSAVPDNLKVNLQRYHARVFDFLAPSTGSHIFPPDRSFEQIKTAMDVEIDPNEYWEVTDGWDGVGLYMYRLIGRQLCAHYKPNYIICPLGTGDLFFGLYLGRQDCLNEKLIPAESCKFLVMMPNQGNILENYERYSMKVRDTYKSEVAHDFERPMAPKLEADYTPLLLTMYQAFLDPAVKLVPVGRKGQDIAARAMFASHMTDFVASEPSALLAFSGLTALVGMIAEESSTRPRLGVTETKTDVVVVNSGCGSMGDEEIRYLAQFFPRADLA